MKKIIILLIILFGYKSNAQKRYLRYNLDDGKSYIQANMRGQFWMRYAQNNPGTTINGEPINDNLDLSLRRFRLGLQSKLGNFYIFSQIGGNNINQNSLRTFRVQVLDLYGEYSFSPEFTLGAGKSSWGTSNRISSFSNGSMANLDALIFSFFTLNRQDDSGRNLGVFAKGQIGKIDYRMAVSTPPFYKGEISDKVDFAVNKTNPRYSSYFKYEFLDNESNTNAFNGSLGTRLGSQDILNIGIGGIYQNKMMQNKVNSDLFFYDFKNISADFYMEKRLSEREDALTTYLGYFYTDFGPDYVRNVGANDIADSKSGTSFNGKGLNVPLMGTGNTLFLSTAYLLPKFNHSTIRVQPDFSIRYANYDGLKSPVIDYNGGVNVYFNGQASKLSLGIQNRPIFNKETLKVDERKTNVILQYQFEIR
ncbi:hypothetical protein KRX57_06180 [Weeksellaceae bacterium TAE3-ERU29]|nr:hypothetical protein [Weeksellaceae bacterium TAE3-ERU29]